MDEEFELELEELFDDELELEFDELFDEEFDDELLDEFEELFPATIKVPSVWPPACLSTECAAAVLCFAWLGVPARAATPATRAALSFQ